MRGNNKGPWGNNPWGGGGGDDGRKPFGGGQQPPDFEELLRKSQQQFKQWFSKNNNENGGRGLILFGSALLVLWLASGIYFVKANEQGVVLRLGAYNRTTTPGINIHLPYPIEVAYTPSVTTVNRAEIGFRTGRGSASEQALAEEGLMLTGDENIVDINFEVQWKISDASAFLFKVRNPEETVKAVSESAMREVIGMSQIATVLAVGREQVEVKTKLLIQQVLDEYQAGVEVVSVNLRDVNPPTQVIAAFRDVQSARVDMETQRNQAEAYRNDIIPKARGQAEQMLQEAEAYKQQVIAGAQGDAARFASVYNEYKQAKDVTRSRMYLETMEEILKGANKTVVEGKGAQGVLPYLPLQELKRKE